MRLDVQLTFNAEDADEGCEPVIRTIPNVQSIERTLTKMIRGLEDAEEALIIRFIDGNGVYESYITAMSFITKIETFLREV